jgi:hypothetical protein
MLQRSWRAPATIFRGTFLKELEGLLGAQVFEQDLFKQPNPKNAKFYYYFSGKCSTHLKCCISKIFSNYSVTIQG